MLNFETIKSFYEKGLWNAQLVKMSVKKGILTSEQANEIIGEKEE
jgi:hypothetical protein